MSLRRRMLMDIVARSLEEDANSETDIESAEETSEDKTDKTEN